jgi:hypothetical protein
MRRFLLGGLLFFCAVDATRAEDPVCFADPKLKAAVEEALQVPDPTPTDMLGLTELNHVEGWGKQNEGIQDLTGLEYATNLQSLNLRLNRVSNISILSALTNLESVDLAWNDISDVSPLAGLSKLKYVSLHANHIRDISPLSNLNNLETLILLINNVSNFRALSGLTKLRELNIGMNSVGDLCPLTSLKQLSVLRISNGEVSDLYPLAGLTNLRVLDASSNHISSVAPLVGLVNLQDVNIRANQVTDISPLCVLKSLLSLDVRDNPLTPESYYIHVEHIMANNPQASIRYDVQPEPVLSVSATIGGHVIDPGLGEFTYPYGATVHLEARADPGFVFAGWSGTYCTPGISAFVTIEQDAQMQANFVSVQGILHVDDDAAGDPGPGDSAVSDPLEDGTPEHPLDSIQEAIDVAGAGITILVQPGTYRENLDCLRKDIQLVGAGPDGPVQMAWPTVEAAKPGPVIYFSGSDGLPRLLTGFIVSGGRSEVGGAIRCEQTVLKMTNCLIVGNYSSDPNGAAVYGTDSQITVTNCTLADNCSGPRSTAVTLVNSDLTATNSIFWNGTDEEILVMGGGKAAIRYSAVRGGWAEAGDFASDPLFARRGWWADVNDSKLVLSPEDAAAVWMAGDYHLQSQAGRWDPQTRTWVMDKLSSPCLDAGDPAGPVGDEPQPNGARLNLGVYGGTTEAGKTYVQ